MDLYIWEFLFFIDLIGWTSCRTVALNSLCYSPNKIDFYNQE